ncbi:hypothetical protein Salat_0880000 [Sesamum alatum]|uniref:RNase H type-1 domain-containing protein n=1 Tax=Sesamum alatum TaxID=300844 RepID=A0AAE2CR57_9LAMI|nr:hypothetical protein Salat_0880000 [Sesamum alatum]
MHWLLWGTRLGGIRRWRLENCCPVCKADGESLHHLILECLPARKIWAISNLPWGVISDWKDTGENWFRDVVEKVDGKGADRALMPQVRSQPSRTPLPPGIIKIDFNGALFSDTGTTGAGIIARNKDGVCLGWWKRHYTFRAEPEYAEMLVVVAAIELCRSNDWRHVILEGDCQTIISKLSTDKLDESSLGSLMQDVKETANLFSLC